MDRQELSEMHERLQLLRAQRLTNGRGISTANTVDPEGLKSTSLGNAPELAPAFDKASGRDGLGPPKGLDSNQTQGSGSEQVKGSGSRQEMRPSPDIAEPVDRQRHVSEMARDDKSATVEHYRSLSQEIQQRQASQQQTHQPGQSR